LIEIAVVEAVDIDQNLFYRNQGQINELFDSVLYTV
jgi:hypothetical protein